MGIKCCLLDSAFADEGHGFVKKENEIKGYTATVEFLDTHLKGRVGGSSVP